MMLPSPKLNILVAFPYFTNYVKNFFKDLDPNTFRLIIDSGAYSVYNSNKKVDMNDYITFLKDIPKQWDFKAVQLDVFGDAKKTYDNLKFMLDKGLDVMPVFTRGDKLERLEEYYTYTDYIMFGGIVVGGQNINYIKWFCEKNKGRKAHWLGFNNTKFIRYFKPESVDSSTVWNGQRFGRLDLYNGHGTFYSLRRIDFINAPDSKAITLLKKLKFYDEINKLQKSEAWKGSQYYEDKKLRGLSGFINTTSHLLRAIDIEKNIGTKIYLACANDKQLKILYESYKHLTEKDII